MDSIVLLVKQIKDWHAEGKCGDALGLSMILGQFVRAELDAGRMTYPESQSILRDIQSLR